MASATSFADRVESGYAALATGAWMEARTSFEAALEEDKGPAALEGLSWAAWWLDDVASCLGAREQAYRAYRAAGDARGAARMALWLGDDHIEFRGEHAVANGWFQRAGRLLESEEPCAEQGWLAAFRAHAALGAGDLRAGLQLGTEVRELGHRLGVVDLEMFGLATEGLALVDLGEVDDGMCRLDEAAAAALGGEYEQIAPAGWTCCYLIYACERVRDYDRAAQWCKKVDEFSSRLGIEFVRGSCRAHYAGILCVHGDWTAADRELDDAMRRLSRTRPNWRAEAVVRLGDLRRRQGRFADAEALFAEVEGHWLARVGTAEVALDRGDPRLARELLERLLERTPPENRARRAAPLELIVRSEAALGMHEQAAEHLSELRSIVESVATQPLRAAACFACGVSAAVAERHDDARRCFEDAVELFSMGEAPFEAARAQVELAASLAALGRPDAARRAARAALTAFATLGATAEESRARSVLRRVGQGNQRESPLTPRELQVLRLVATGLGDRDIARELTISDHTVHRHVANIYAKLGCSNRAAAVADAHRLELL